MDNSILLIEGNKDIREVVCNRLTAKGYIVMGVETISEAQSFMENTTPGLILLDIQLPDGNGLGFCKQLRSNDSNIPIMFLNSRTKDKTRKIISEAVNRYECFAAGCNGYLSKPFDLKDLYWEIANLLTKNTQQNSNRTSGQVGPK